MPGNFQHKRHALLDMEVAITGAATSVIDVSDATWITFHVMELGVGAGTAHTWAVQGDSEAAGTPNTITSGITCRAETDITAGTLKDTYDVLTVSSGLFSADVSADVMSHYIVDVDPVHLGNNTTSGLPNRYLRLLPSAASANTQATAILAILDVRHHPPVTAVP